jgi:hypothetical protein
MASYQDFLDAFKPALQDLAKQTLDAYSKQATTDGQAFLDAQKANLDKWTKELVDAELSKDDFADLVKGIRDLAELVALKQAGLAAARLDAFRTSLMNLVIDTAFKVFL